MFSSLQDVIDRVGMEKVVQCLDRDADGKPDPPLVATLLTDSNKHVTMMLNRKGYSLEQLKRLAKDESLRRQAAWIAAEFMVFMKPELISPDGTTLYTPLSKRAMDNITAIALATFRPQAEQIAGAPSTMSAQIFEAQPAFEFAANEDHPRGRGGF